MKNFFRRTLTTLLIVACVLTASLVGATVKLYTATAEDYASERESQDVAKLRARDKAIKKATGEAGVYLKTYSRSVNNELTDDEVLAITSNSWQLVGEPKYTRSVKQISDETSIIVWTATVEVNVDDAELQSWLNRDDKDKSTIITQTREAQTAFDENERTIEDLRESYNRAASQADRDKIRRQMNDADRDFLANQRLDEGNRLYYVKDFNGAIRLYNEALQLKPNYPEAYYNRGSSYAAGLRQYERAIQDYDKAIQLNPNMALAYSDRGTCYDILGQFERAIQDFDKAIKLERVAANLAGMHSNRGIVHFELGQIERAIQDFDKAVQFNPNMAEAYSNRGCVYMDALRQYERAIQDFNKAIDVNPTYLAAYGNRGLAHYHLKNYKQAFADLNKFIELCPNEEETAEAFYYRGLCHKAFGDEAKAQADFAKAKQLGYGG